MRQVFGSNARPTISHRDSCRSFHGTDFHPHVGAGADLSWESTTEQIEPVYFFGDPNRVQRALRDARTDRRRAFVVRPCVEVGFKAYLSPRAFFRTDLRVRTGSRTDEALIRFGFGTDF